MPSVLCDLLLAIALPLLPFAAAQAQTYPTKPIRIVVPFAPGMSELLGQPVIVENRAGAGGMIGGEHVAKSPPDGYTLLMATNSIFSIVPSVYPKPLYHPVRDFAAVTALTSVPFILTVHPSVPARTFSEFRAIAKSGQPKLVLANGGTGTSSHLVGELMQMQIGSHMPSIPYKGSGPALVDLVGGHVDAFIDQLSTSIV